VRGGRGLTLVELLVALAIAGVVLTLLAGLTAGARQGAGRTERRADTVATLRLSAELLAEELRLAGTVPWPPPANPAPEALAAWLEPAVTVALGPAGDAVGLRGIDHRLAGAPLQRDVVFEVVVDGAGEWQLYRRPLGSPRQPLVAGVTGLHVRWVVTAAGARVSPVAADGQRIAALGLEIVVAGESLSVVAELPARPLLAVRSAP